MKLSTKARYGLRAMCYMAENYGKGALSLNSISHDMGLSEKYLEQLLSSLRKAELIQATRGANGGYFLDKSPTEISVGQIIRALEDGLVIVDCITGNCSNKCGHTSKCDCNTYDVWDKLYKAINCCLDSMSLASIIAK